MCLSAPDGILAVVGVGCCWMCSEGSLVQEVSCWKDIGDFTSKSVLGIRDHQ